MRRTAAVPCLWAALEDACTGQRVALWWDCSQICQGRGCWLTPRRLQQRLRSLLRGAWSARESDEGCSAHCNVWQQHQTHFNVVQGWVGPQRGPGGGEAGSGVVWFLRQTASTIGRRSSAEMDFTMSLTLAERREGRYLDAFVEFHFPVVN